VSVVVSISSLFLLAKSRSLKAQNLCFLGKSVGENASKRDENVLKLSKSNSDIDGNLFPRRWNKIFGYINPEFVFYHIDSAGGDCVE